MKYKLLSLDSPLDVNIGDYIQALASSQFYPRVDGFLDREELSNYDGDPCKVIMNGWYMYKPENWPPSLKIDPLFVAFHLNVMVKDKMLEPLSVQYFKKHEPIGCRDYNTVRLLESKGIKAYFSACMTLTLGRKYHSDEKNGICYIVDPAVPNLKNFAVALRYIPTLLLSFNDVRKTCGKLYNGKLSLKNLLKASSFLFLYSKIFEKDLLKNAEYITHQSEDYKVKFPNHESLLKEAERLVKNYSKAQLVITSRIHCALPCLGMGTPVIFTERENDDFVSSCRFEGLRELFNVLKIDNTSITPDFVFDSKVSKDNVPTNKKTWVPYSEKLTQLCVDFVREI